MRRDRSERKLPKWISEYIPKELVESALFRFNIELQTVIGFKCSTCGARYDDAVETCTSVVDGVVCAGTKFEKRNKRVTVDLLSDIDVDYSIVEEQMQDIPAMYAFYSAVYSEARYKVATEERRLKAVRGTLIERVQQRAAKENVRLSVDQVKYVVDAETGIIDADRRLQFAQMQCGKLFHMLEALKMKADLARSLSASKRKEHEQS